MSDFCKRLGELGLGQVLDIVPNHMSLGRRTTGSGGMCWRMAHRAGSLPSSISIGSQGGTACAIRCLSLSWAISMGGCWRSGHQGSACRQPLPGTVCGASSADCPATRFLAILSLRQSMPGTTHSAFSPTRLRGCPLLTMKTASNPRPASRQGRAELQIDGAGLHGRTRRSAISSIMQLRILNGRSWIALDDLLNQQTLSSFVLAHGGPATQYRRFFDVNSLDRPARRTGACVRGDACTGSRLVEKRCHGRASRGSS